MSDIGWNRFGESTTTKHALCVSRWSFSLREVILAILSLGFVLVVLILMGLVATFQGTSDSGEDFCVTKQCLDTASRAVDFRNASVNPCDNFYQYACGNYKNARPLTSTKFLRSPVRDLYYQNIHRLETILLKPVNADTNWASEKKLKEFYEACTDDFARERLKGKPFLQEVVAPLGGWWVLGNWNEEGWDFNDMLKKVHTDFGVDAFFYPWLQYADKKFHIEIMPASPVHLEPFRKYSGDAKSKQYDKFIRRMAALLVRDSDEGAQLGESVKNQRLDQFVEDVKDIENIIFDLKYNHPFEEEIPMTPIADAFRTRSNDVIEWMDQIRYYFEGVEITRETKGFIYYREYYSMLNSQLHGMDDRNRKLNNFLVWKTLARYSRALSYEYSHQRRAILHDLYGYVYKGTYDRCFWDAKWYMNHALSHLYIQEFFDEKNREMTKDISNHVKTVMQKQLDVTPWFDEATKKYAKEKLDIVALKMGYPDWLANNQLVDAEYENVEVDKHYYLRSLLSLSQTFRQTMKKFLSSTNLKEDWHLDAYSTMMMAILSWNEVHAGGGILQFPFYDWHQPHYSTFGAFGVHLARMLHHFIDGFGKKYDMKGDLIKDGGSFWSQSSTTNYNKVSTCVKNLYIDKTNNFSLDGRPAVATTRTLFLNKAMKVAIAHTSGLRVALKAYALWAKEQRLAEKMLPGLSLTNQQMIFLSFAQTMCSNQDPQYASWFYYRGRLPDEVAVNTAMGELEEFAQAFQCNAGDNMNHAERCQYF